MDSVSLTAALSDSHSSTCLHWLSCLPPARGCGAIFDPPQNVGTPAQEGFLVWRRPRRVSCGRGNAAFGGGRTIHFGPRTEMTGCLAFPLALAWFNCHADSPQSPLARPLSGARLRQPWPRGRHAQGMECHWHLCVRSQFQTSLLQPIPQQATTDISICSSCNKHPMGIRPGSAPRPGPPPLRRTPVCGAAMWH